MNSFSFKKTKIGVLILVSILCTVSILFLRSIPSIGIEISENNNKINYLNLSNEVYYRQTVNNCAPYSVMGVINVLTGEIKDPKILAEETTWRILKNLTFPQGLIDLLHNYNVKTKEYSLKLYQDNEKAVWLKNQIDNGNPIIVLVKAKIFSIILL
jgi:hypothetical protein